VVHEKKSLVCPAVVCPLACILDTRVAECNAGKCEMVAIADIACGGFTTNPHKCPEGYDCTLSHIPDVPGTCTEAPKAQTCGGIGNIACPDGWECVADPAGDGCDPTKGGADCSGICQAKDCRATGCAAGSNCQICWANWACVPEGAAC
jgi:hypothetical protein